MHDSGKCKIPSRPDFIFKAAKRQEKIQRPKELLRTTIRVLSMSSHPALNYKKAYIMAAPKLEQSRQDHFWKNCIHQLEPQVQKEGLINRMTVKSEMKHETKPESWRRSG